MSTPAQAAQGQQFDPVAAARQKWPGLRSWSDGQILKNLSDPAHFRQAFPQYAGLDDATIRSNMARYHAAPQASHAKAAPSLAVQARTAPTEYQGAFTPYHPRQETALEKLALGTPNEPTTFGQGVFESLPQRREKFNRAGQPLYQVSEVGPTAGPKPGETVTLGQPAKLAPNVRVALPQTAPEDVVNQTRATALPMIRPSLLINKERHPFLRGATEAAESMTSPESIGMLASTGLFGALPEAAQAVIPRLVSAGFTAQTIKTAWDQNKAFQQALKSGDENEAMRILGQFAVNATLGTLAGKHALLGEAPATLGTLERSKATEPELVVNGDLARDRLARRMNDVRANQAARQGLGELERRIEAGRQERVNAPITLPKLGEEPPAMLKATPRPAPTLAEQAAEAREQLADEGRLEPRGALRVVDRRTLAPELRESPQSPIRSPEGALYGNAPKLGNRLALPPATRAPEETEFLAGRPAPTPRLATIPGLGVVEETSERRPAGLAPRLGVPVTAAPAEPAPLEPVRLGEPPQGLRGTVSTAERLRREGKLPPVQPSESPLAPQAQLGVPPVEREAQAYLENVDRIKGKLKRAKGAQAASDGAWLASTDNTLRRAFNAEKRPGELFGDFLQRIAGRPDLKPKSLPFHADYPNFSVTPRTESTEPLEKAKATPYQRQQAQLTVNRIRDLVRREYAQSYLRAKLEGLPAPDRGSLGSIGAGAIRSDIDYALSKQKAQPVREQFPPDVIDEAEAQMRGAHDLLSSMPQAGRYRKGPASGLREDESKFDEWYGVTSGRNVAAGMFPWYEDETVATPAQVKHAVEKGNGADYERIVRHIAEGIMQERETAAPIIAEYAPQLRELAQQVRSVDPALAQNLEDVASGKLTLAAPKLRKYIEEQITNAETQANAATALDAAEAEAGEQAGLAESSGTAHQAGAEQGPHPVAESAAPGELARENEGEADTSFNPEEFGSLSAADLDRLLRDESGAASPELIADLLSGRLGREAWQRFVASPLVRGLGLGDKYEAVKRADPEIAEHLHVLDNAASYFRQRAQRAIRNIVGGLSRQQERLFSLMADADSRENLRQNHPAEYQAAMRDPAIQDALRKYRPIERELTEARERMGGATLPGDYLRRIYEQHVSGIGKEQAPGERVAGVPFDKVIRPARVPGQSREATAEYHYQQGLHEFGPAFGTKYLGTNLAAMRDAVARDFIGKATELPEGSTLPRSIRYNGKTYFRPDIAAEMGHGAEAFAVYDPTAGLKYPAKADVGKRYLGPAEVVHALADYGERREAPGGWARSVNRFLQEQVVGFGLGLPHVANILRRVMQAEPGAQLNPRAWADAWRVLFGRELRARGIKGIDDPTFDKLAKHGAITPGDMQELKKYWGGNLNPANWARSLAQVGHRLLFEPGTFHGLGGIDQRARIWVADLVKSQHPEFSDAQIADAVSTELGNYNRRNWTETQKRVAPFMLFPGWSLSSLRWVLEHPIKTTVPPALLVLAANQAIHHLGGNTSRDAWDIQNIHLGNRSIGVTLLRESMARNLLRPALNYAGSKLLGETGNRPERAAAYGAVSGAAGLAGTLNPILTGGIALATKRQDVFNHRDLWQPQDWNTPGVVMPNKALDSIAALALRHAIPSLDRILQPGEPLDFAEFAGGNIGLPNYRQGPADRLKRNAAQSSDAYSALRRLAKTSPAEARAYVKDPQNAALLIFHSDLEHMASVLKRMDEAQAAIKNASQLSPKERAERLKAIEAARTNLLRQADGLDRLIFKRWHGGKRKPETGGLPPVLGVKPASMAQPVGAQR